MRFVAIARATLLLAAGAVNAQDHPEIAERPASLQALDGEWASR